MLALVAMSGKRREKDLRLDMMLDVEQNDLNYCWAIENIFIEYGQTKELFEKWKHKQKGDKLNSEQLRVIVLGGFSYQLDRTGIVERRKD